ESQEKRWRPPAHRLAERWVVPRRFEILPPPQVWRDAWPRPRAWPALGQGPQRLPHWDASLREGSPIRRTNRLLALPLPREQRCLPLARRGALSKRERLGWALERKQALPERVPRRFRESNHPLALVRRLSGPRISREG